VASELILVVEDNDKNRKLVRDVLTFKGYEIIEAETGEEGVVWPKSAPQAWS
jgi:two-component system cell cycle response regulator DivK